MIVKKIKLYSPLKIALLSTLLIWFNSCSTLAYWLETAKTTKQLVKSTTARIGIFPWKNIKILNTSDSYNAGDLISYVDNQGKERIIIAKRAITPPYTHPNSIPKLSADSNDGKFYSSNVWFEDLSGTFVAYNKYVTEDIVKHNNKLYIMVGDYRLQNSSPQALYPKVHDPFTNQNWAIPGQADWLYGKVHWQQVAHYFTATSEYFEKFYTAKTVYFKGDVVYYPINTFITRDSSGYVLGASITNSSQMQRFTLIKDNNTGISNIPVTNSEYWRAG